VLDDLPALVERCSTEDVAALVALTASVAARSDGPRTSREERAARRALRTALDAKGVPDAAQAADVLVDMGENDATPEVLAVLRSPDSAALLDAAFHLTSLLRNSDNIELAANRSAKIVFALKRYAHPGADGACTADSLIDGMDTILTLYQNQIKRGIDVVREYEGDPVVEGLHDELNQVWTNLVHNALQAMGPTGELRVAVRGAAETVEVQVIDSGTGIAPEAQGRLFEPFFTTKPMGEGSGLGLSICKDIIDRHHGRIDVASEPGRTCFTVTLPRRCPENRDGAPQ
jgi:signal transduction histidine kinase